jgi:hypothetical protein
MLRMPHRPRDESLSASPPAERALARALALRAVPSASVAKGDDHDAAIRLQHHRGRCRDAPRSDPLSSRTPLGEVAALVQTERSVSVKIHPVSSLGLIAWQLSASKGARMDQPTQELHLDLARAAASGPLDAEAGEVTASQIVTINPDETSGRAA